MTPERRFLSPGEDCRKKPSFTERFRYWFDNHMSRGSLSLIRLLAAATLAAVFLLGGLVLLLGFSDGDGPFSALWDSFATIINAWMPYYGDGSPGYLVLMALGALFGILFTSLLIGIISSAIEERLDQLKKGTSRVLEKDHYVIPMASTSLSFDRLVVISIKKRKNHHKNMFGSKKYSMF